MDPTTIATPELIRLATEQTASNQLNEGVLREIQARYSRPDCPPEDRAAIVALNASVFIPRFGFTKLPPGIRHLPGAKNPPNVSVSASHTTRTKNNTASKSRGVATKALFTDVVRAALSELLQSKHLFQSVHVDTEPVLNPVPKKKRIPRDLPLATRAIVSAVEEIPRNHVAMQNAFAELRFNLPWRFTGTAGPAERNDGWVISLPIISIPCAHCHGADLPHHPKLEPSEVLSALHQNKNSESRLVQIFALPYQCQKCISEPLLVFI